MGKIIGIDLGTTNSAVAVVENGTPDIISNAEGKRTTPSVVAFNDGETIVGDTAKNQRTTNSDNTVSSVKRHMGTRKEFSLDGKTYVPEEIAARILQKLRRDAAAYIGSDVAQAVITVPAYFDNDQREATKKAGEIAGLEVLRIVNEPTAAALAYGLDKRGKTTTVLVFDLGGGTFDVSILEMADGIFDVKSTCGDSHLGGDDFDEAICKYLMDRIRSDHSAPDEDFDAISRARVLEAAENAKITLSSSLATKVILPFLFVKDGQPVSVEIEMSRADLVEIIAPIVSKTRGPLNQVLKDAKMSSSDLDEVILVGGSTRVPYIIDQVKEWTGMDPSHGVNPDEVVALGASIQAAVLVGDETGIVLLDVTPLTLSIETQGELATAMIARNTTIPTSQTDIFTTASDGQTEVNIKIAQGERAMFFDNKQIGSFMLDGIPSAPRGIPKIEVEFSLDSDGILNVSAIDKATNKEQSIVITGNSYLEDADIERMVQEAEDHEEEDKKKRKQIELRNNAEQMMYAAKKLIGEHEESLTEELVQSITEDVATVSDNLMAENPEVLKQAVEAMEKSVQAAGTYLYEQAAQKQAAEAASAAETSDSPDGVSEEVKDADFVSEA